MLYFQVTEPPVKSLLVTPPATIIGAEPEQSGVSSIVCVPSKVAQTKAGQFTVTASNAKVLQPAGAAVLVTVKVTLLFCSVKVWLVLYAPEPVCVPADQVTA